MTMFCHLLRLGVNSACAFVGEGACLPDSMVSLPEIEASPPPSLPKPESGQPNEAALLGKEQTPFIPDWIAAYSPFSRQPPSTSNDK